jgi:hypothetical protein
MENGKLKVKLFMFQVEPEYNFKLPSEWRPLWKFFLKNPHIRKKHQRNFKTQVTFFRLICTSTTEVTSISY